MIGLQMLYGSLFVVWAIARLRPVSRSDGASDGRLSQIISRRARRFLPRPACGDDAIWWKERYVSRTTPVAKILAVLVFLAMLAALGRGTYAFAQPAFQEIRSMGFAEAAYRPSQLEFNAFLRAIVTLVYVCWMVGTASSASAGLTSEREEDTWVSLVSTPLSPEEIIRGKMLGALWTTRWIGLLWLALVLTGVALGAIHPFGLVGSLVVTAVYVWFACALGTLCSLNARSSSRSLTATIALLIVCNGAYLMPAAPFRMESSLRLLGVTPFVCVLALMSYQDVRWLLDGGPARSGQIGPADALITSFSSLAAYGVAAALITLYLVVNFDEAIDRPREGGRDPSKPSSKGEPADDLSPVDVG
jgi:hypothetical protein